MASLGDFLDFLPRSVEDDGRNLGFLVIDLQKSFLNYLAVEQRNLMLAAQKEVLSFAAEKDYPIAVLEYNGSGKTISQIDKLTKRSKRRILIEKEHNNGFLRTELGMYLKSAKINKLCIMGINGPYCVKATAEGALKEGLEIVTSESLIGAQSGSNQQRDLIDSYSWFDNNGDFSEDHQGIIDSL